MSTTLMLMAAFLVGAIVEKWTSNELHRKLKPGETCSVCHLVKSEAR